jgi:uncharacterized membrane protein YedE/YeeE
MHPLLVSLQATIATQPQTALAAGGFGIGLVFGFAAARTNFCVMGALSDWRTFANPGRLGAVALAAAVAIIGAQTLFAAGAVDLTRSMYLLPRINWAGAILGGLMFGAGMVYAGGCASRNLIRAGGGDLRSLVVLITLTLAAFATISGVLAPLRDGFEQATALTLETRGAGLDDIVARFGLADETARVFTAALLALPLLAFAMLKGRLLSEPVNLAGGFAVGLLVTIGWWLTGMTYDEMAVRPLPPASLSFVRPVADTFDWLERSTALGLPGFGAATVFGALSGSALASITARRFHLTGFADTDDFLRHLGGAAAMGAGGVLALGCSIGQGITGLSTLSVQSLIAAASIAAGALLALARLERSL